jgi:hypothetical protein
MLQAGALYARFITCGIEVMQVEMTDQTVATTKLCVTL